MFPTKGGRLERGLKPVHRRQRAILIALPITKALALFVRESVVRAHDAIEVMAPWSSRAAREREDRLEPSTASN